MPCLTDRSATIDNLAERAAGHPAARSEPGLLHVPGVPALEVLVSLRVDPPLKDRDASQLLRVIVLHRPNLDGAVRVTCHQATSPQRLDHVFEGRVSVLGHLLTMPAPRRARVADRQECPCSAPFASVSQRSQSDSRPAAEYQPGHAVGGPQAVEPVV